MIPPEREAQILRYHHVEKWRPNTIAVQFGVHHTTVQRVLAQAGLPRPGPAARHSAVDPYAPLIVTTLQLSARRVFDVLMRTISDGRGRREATRDGGIPSTWLACRHRAAGSARGRILEYDPFSP